MKLTFNINPNPLSPPLDSIRDSMQLDSGICIASLSHALQKAGGHLFPLGWWHLLRAQRHYDTDDMMLVGVSPKWRGKGLSAIVHDRLGHRWQQLGIRWCISNPQFEDNDALKVWETYREKELYIRRRVYFKNL